MTTARKPEYPPPANLSEAAASVWVETVAASRNPQRIVGPGLEAYCVQVARMRDARARIDQEGELVTDAKGNPVPHPAIPLERAASEYVQRMQGKLT